MDLMEFNIKFSVYKNKKSDTFSASYIKEDDFLAVCELYEFHEISWNCRFRWKDLDGQEIDAPDDPKAILLEEALHGFARGFYAR